MLENAQLVVDYACYSCKDNKRIVEEFDLPPTGGPAPEGRQAPPGGAHSLDERVDMTAPNSKTELLSTIVASFAARADVTTDDIVALVAKLSRELGIDETGPEAPPAPSEAGHLTPALPIARAVTPDKVFCLCCGKGFKMLKRHLGAEHGMTEAEYRGAFGLPEEMPLVAPNYSQRKANYARKVGFGRYSREAARQGDETVD